MKTSRVNFVPCLVAAIAVVVAARMMPHPPNVTPIAAMAIFGGAVLSSRLIAAIAVLTSMLISDALIGMHGFMPVVYGCLIGNVLIGSSLRGASDRLASGRSWAMIAGGTFAGSLLFFLVTNFVFWMSYYPPTLTGLMASYTAAIPFFQNSLTGDMVYSGLMFAALGLSRMWAGQRLVVAQAA